jgi:hypothetical protein
MTDTLLHPAPYAAAPHGDGDAAVRADVQEVVRGFAKALRTHLLYEGQSPSLDRFVESLRERMGGLWSRLPYLRVQIEEREIVWEGAAAYTGEERDNLAFLLYRDGIRELSFQPGFEGDDLDRFVSLLARVHRLRADEEDLLTLLWDHDWECLRYRYVEPLAEGVKPPEASGQTPSRAPRPPREDPEPSRSVSTEDFQEALYFLDEGEMRRLEAELHREMGRDLWTDVLNALFDRLDDGTPERQKQVIGICGDILPTLLGAARLGTAAYMLAELVKTATAGRFGPAVLRAMRGLFSQLAQAETVGELARIVEQEGEALDREQLSALLAFFPPEALGPLLKAGECSATPGSRTALLAAAERLASITPAALRPLAADADPDVAAGAARLIGRLKVVEGGPDLAGLLAHADARVRLAAVEALQELRSPTGSGALETVLEDADRDVRVAAARALAALRWAPARARLEQVLDSRRLRESELTERIAFFEAYGALAGAESVPLLDRVLNGKSWLGRRETGEMRACAALGLGRVRHPASEKALTAAAADADPVVRSAVGRALRAIKQP